MTQTLCERVDLAGTSPRIDHQQHILRGVKLLGLVSKNGRTYREQALASAAPLYEGAKVNVNHDPAGPAAPRDYEHRLGTIRNVVFRPGDGLFGDLHYNPRHPVAEQLVWDAEHAPANVGLSHNVEARTRTDGDLLVVEAITTVRSVDLVADPATTRGLFESQSAEAAVVDQQIATLLREHGLPAVDDARPSARAIISPLFLSQLRAATTEQRGALVRDRALAVASGGLWRDWLAEHAVSREQVPLPQLAEQRIASARDWARAITR